MSKKTVFLSYSHDSDGHREQVLALSERLREDGILTILDQYVNGSPAQGWPRWMLDQLDAADYVLIICTETYYRRFRGHEVPGLGKGVDWEGALITQEIYHDKGRTSKFVPVLLSSSDEKWIPEPLRSGTRYALTSADGYQRLYDFLLQQAGVEPGPVGSLKVKPRRTAGALAFAETSPARAVQVDISRIIKYAPAELIGREAETSLLNDAWAKVQAHDPKRPHVLTFVALGGEGKTSLAARWAADLAGNDWPGCDAVFAWSFYSQGAREQIAVSSDLFLTEALAFFGDAALAGSAAGAFDKGRRLAQLVGGQRTLLILDGVEPLQYAPTSPTPGELKDQGLAALLKGLAATSDGLCVVTTRYTLPDLRAFWQTTAPEVKLLRLSRAAGVHLLKAHHVKGSELRHLPFNGGPEMINEFEQLVEDVKGHALTLNLLGAYLHDAHGGDIRKRDLVKWEDADAEEQGGRAFGVMDAYVKSFESEGEKGRRALALLRLLGLFDRPATVDCMNALWKGDPIAGLTESLTGLTEAQRNLTLKRLEDTKLLTVNRVAGSGELLALDAHPLLREYFAKRGREQQPAAWRTAHRRLYEHLCATTQEGDQPTLDDLQPLYQAVAHGCQAGLQEETCSKVYHDRIKRGKENHSSKKLGAFGADLGAIACFFETPWSKVSPALSEAAQSWLLSEASFRLRALGRLAEALEPMRSALQAHLRQEDWANVVRGAGNLSEMELMLGELAGAVADAELSVTHADRGTDAYQPVDRRTSLADALHQAGRRDDAEALFHEAEMLQRNGPHPYEKLYSLQGFRYCDLLLAGAERAAWRGSLHSSPASPPSAASDACLAVAQRAAQTLKLAEDNKFSLLSAAMDRLTLGRAALYEAVLAGSTLDPAHLWIDQAVGGIRRAGTQHWIAAALLTRAWLRFLTGARTGSESAQADLDEAWEIAERGPMKLFMADIHLHRARLFFREARYPWETPAADLASAGKLIHDCSYHRRDEELADAKQAILSPDR